MLGPPIWDLVALIPTGVHKAGVYSVEVYSAEVYNAQATDFGPGSPHTCRGPQGRGLQCGGLQRLSARGAFAFTIVGFERSRCICAYYSNV